MTKNLTIKKKSIRIITTLILVLALFFTSVIPSQAAGVETWSQAQGPMESIRVTNNNTTPVKTIGRTGTLTIVNWISRCSSEYCTCSDREPISYSNIKVYMKIYNCDTGEVLASGWFPEHETFAHTLTTSRPVVAGERIQIYFDVRSVNNPPGPYRKAHISYYYKIF